MNEKKTNNSISNKHLKGNNNKHENVVRFLENNPDLTEALEDNPEVLELIEENPDAVIKKLNYRKATATFFEGPIPHPNILEGYKEIDSDFPNRIFTMAEEQSKHRRSQEDKDLDARINSNKRGSYFAFIVCMTGLLGGIFLLSTDKSLAGYATMITSIGSILGVSIYNNKTQKNINNGKRKKEYKLKKDSKSDNQLEDSE